MYNRESTMTISPPHRTETDRSSSSSSINNEIRALDCNLTSLCDHIQMEGFNSGAFSDVVVNSMGSSYNLHRLILSRSSYFRNMLHGPWKESGSPVVNLHVDDKNVNADAIAIALAYIYGHHPKLSDDNAFRVLAAASFLDLQDLCAICTDFIISELWTSNFLAYQVFAENQDYGIHGERVRNACWGYLCQSGYVELKEVLPKLSSQTLHALLTSDELWVSSEEKRFELALHTLLAKRTSCKTKLSGSRSNNSTMGMSICSDSCKSRGGFGSCCCTMETELGHLNLKDDQEVCKPADKNILEQTDEDFQTRSISESTDSKQEVQHKDYVHPNWELRSPSNREQSSSLTSSSFDTNGLRTSCSYMEMPVCIGGGHGYNGVAIEGPSDENSCYHMNSNGWLGEDKTGHYTSVNSCNEFMLDGWGRCVMPPLSWGGRVVGRRQMRGFANGNFGVRGEVYDAFRNIFEGGCILFCNMPFEVLLNFRIQLEELGFPCKAISDGLWLQMLLRQRVQEIAADTCKSCCLTSTDCACRQPFGFSNGVSTNYYMQEHSQNNARGSMGNIYIAESPQNEGNGPFRPVRVHVRGPNDGLAGIGRGAASVPAGGWPPTRFVYSRVPFNADNRNGQQSLANDDSDIRVSHSEDNPGDGLTAVVGLNQRGCNITNFNEEKTDRQYRMDLTSSLSGNSCGPSTSAIPVQMLASDNAIGMEWETPSNSISLDMKTPLSHFPPFRFGVEFEELHRLGDGQVKHSPEFFYAGSLWKVSVQAFNDEDPQGRRTLGLFLHRRKAEISESSRKVHMYIDSREKVRARFQLICPSKREVMVFGSSKQKGTPLPKAPKGWGWRTALLFDELPDLLQNGALRVAAIVQLV